VTRFVEEAIARAGLLPVLAARRSGDVETLVATMGTWRKADLLALGAVADDARRGEVGEVVRIHRSGDPAPDVTWVDAAENELELLREIAVVRIAAPRGARVGVDWGRHGLELAQVALGFGATDLRGPITKKSGLPILPSDARKVKGQGMVDLSAIKRREIEALVRHAGRRAVFVDEEPQRAAEEDVRAVVHP
jgi:hypothetical protein